MRILLVNKFHYLKGGSEKYYFELAEILKKKGHEVAFFSMKDEKNIQTQEKEYFVESMDLNSNNKLKALDVIYSKANKQKMKETLEAFKPDIVHVNNFQRQLSASIIEAIEEKNIPIIFTAHDIQAVCPAIVMLDGNKNVCEKCMGGNYTSCVKNKCIKDSILKSILGAIEARYYRKKKIYTNKINHIITPSEFYKSKLVQDGIEKSKITALHNFISVEKYNVKTEDEGYALYFGRLSKEKGILNLIEAFSKIEKGKLYIAGDGPEKEKIEEWIQKKKLQSRIQLVGLLTQEQVTEYVRKCRFVIVPSVWYENCPYSILETLAIGKPVVGANIAGIPELIKDNQNGFLYPYNDTERLKEKMETLLQDKELAEAFGRNAKGMATKLYSKEYYYTKLIEIYENALKGEK